MNFGIGILLSRRWINYIHFSITNKPGKRGYLADNSEQFVVGPEFCGGALSKGR